MKKLTSLVFLVLLTGSLIAEEPFDCFPITAQIKDSLEKRPDDLLMIIEDALTANEKCTCEIVKTAIITSQADNEKVGQIVYTAVSIKSSMAAIIQECALQVAPNAAGEIKSSVEKALGNPYYYGSEKNPKQLDIPMIDNPSTRERVSVSGTYLIPPVAPSGGVIEKTVIESITAEERDVQTTTPVMSDSVGSSSSKMALLNK